jgi:hypothetical protein
LTQAYLSHDRSVRGLGLLHLSLRQNFKQIPNELYLAAKVDGKSDWSFLWKVMVPLAAPTLISICILKFMGTWNSYVWPNLVTKSADFRLISNGLAWQRLRRCRNRPGQLWLSNGRHRSRHRSAFLALSSSSGNTSCTALVALASKGRKAQNREAKALL